MKVKKPKILFYDIETTLLLSHHFSLGKQHMNHKQLLKGYFNRTHIICITYKFSDERKAGILTWGESQEDEIAMIKEFDKLVNKADIIIGKNSNRFDNKHMNTQRLWYDLDGMSDFAYKCDDLEVQMRKYFYLPSYSLDYLSETLGLGGKNTMCLQDWIDINYYRMYQLNDMTKASQRLLEFLTNVPADEIIKRGKAALKKMFVYGKKDAVDTERLWKRCVKQFTPKHNMNTFINDSEIRCIRCGSNNVHKNGTAANGKTRYQRYRCSDCRGYAGRASISKSGKVGKIG